MTRKQREAQKPREKRKPVKSGKRHHRGKHRNPAFGSDILNDPEAPAVAIFAKCVGAFLNELLRNAMPPTDRQARDAELAELEKLYKL